MWVAVVLAVAGVLLLGFACLLVCAPYGWEDDQGFHRGQK